MSDHCPPRSPDVPPTPELHGTDPRWPFYNGYTNPNLNDQESSSTRNGCREHVAVIIPPIPYNCPYTVTNNGSCCTHHCGHGREYTAETGERRENSRGNCNQKKTWRCLFGIRFMIFMIIVAFSATCIFFYHQLKKIESERTSFCLPCKTLVNFDTSQLAKTLSLKQSDEDSEEGELCCATSPKQRAALQKLLIETSLQQQKTQGVVGTEIRFINGSFSDAPKPMALLLNGKADTVDQAKSGSRSVQIKSWRHSTRGAFLNNMTLFPNGSLQIPTSGYYHVLSQIYFIKNNERGDTDMKVYNFENSIYRYHPLYNSNGHERLVANVESVCWPSVSQVHHTSRLERTIKLRAGDQLYVKSNHVGFLGDPYKNYFGVYLIQPLLTNRAG